MQLKVLVCDWVKQDNGKQTWVIWLYDGAICMYFLSYLGVNKLDLKCAQLHRGEATTLFSCPARARGSQVSIMCPCLPLVVELRNLVSKISFWVKTFKLSSTFQGYRWYMRAACHNRLNNLLWRLQVWYCRLHTLLGRLNNLFGRLHNLITYFECYRCHLMC